MATDALGRMACDLPAGSAAPPPVVGLGRRAPRIALVDAARGVALAGMVFYHFSWDLAFFRFIDGATPLSPPYKTYAHVVASTFLMLVGASLVLAGRGGIRRDLFVRRLGAITAAAAAISLLTLWLFPDRMIFFGTLHCIAVASVVAVPFLRGPLWLVGVAAAACLVLPTLVAAPLFDAPAFWWLGLGTVVPATYDYRPLLPWLGMVLIGILAARIALAWRSETVWSGWSPASRISRMLVWGGRNSLLVYLGHQPVLLGALFLVVQATGTPPEAEGRSFLQACNAQCLAKGADPAACSNGCFCLAAELRAEGLWTPAIDNRATAEESGRVGKLALACGSRPANGEFH